MGEREWLARLEEALAENRQLTEQLTVVQARCTELLKENRFLRGLTGDLLGADTSIPVATPEQNDYLREFIKNGRPPQ